MLRFTTIIFTTLISFSAFGQAGTVTGVVTNIDKATNHFSITEGGGRVTAYEVDATFTMTLNGSPSRDMRLKDSCAVTVVTPPKAKSAACKR